MNRKTEIQFGEGQQRGRDASGGVDASPYVNLDTVDKENGTVGAVFATDARVLSFNWDIGTYHEVLGFEKNMVRMDRLNTAAPIFDRHDSRSDDLGIVLPGSAVLGKTNITGTLRFDLNDVNGAGKRAFQKIVDGFWRTFSVGYRVYKLRYIEEAPDGYPVYLATDWEPMEVSTAPMAADIEAQARSAENKNSNSKIEIQKPTMEPKTPEVIEQERQAAQKELDRQLAAARNAGADDATKAERTRVATIIELGAKHKLEPTFVRTHVETTTTAEAFSLLVLDEVSKRQPTTKGNIRVIERFASVSERQLAMEEAVLVRLSDKDYGKTATIKENPYRHRTLLEISDEYLEANGGDMSGSARQRVANALKISAREVGMSTSDLPNLFANVLNKILRKEYNFQTGKWQAFCYNQPATRINQAEKSINFGDFVDMPQVKEGGEYILQQVADEAEDFTVRKFGSKFAITIEMIINDDLGGMQRMGMKAAKADAFTEDFLVWNLLKTNPKMSDGNSVFSSAHKNLAAASAISYASINELWMKITKQTGLNKKPLDIDPKFIITGRNNQALVDQILNPNLRPITPGDAVASYIKTLTPIYTNYIDDYGFYLAADPSDIDTIRFGGLVGEPDFAMENYYEPGSDAWMYKMRKYFGASFTDFRGLAFNPGQAPA